MDTNVPQANTATFANRKDFVDLVLELNHLKHVVDELNDRLKSQTKAIRTRISQLEADSTTTPALG